MYNAEQVRAEMGGPFASIMIPAESARRPAPQFVEL